MPFDSLPQETKPDFFSLEGLIAWLETKNPDETYDFEYTPTCLLTQWLNARGVRAQKTPDYPDGVSPYHGAFSIVACHDEQTFGAALKRARKLLAGRQ